MVWTKGPTLTSGDGESAGIHIADTRECEKRDPHAGGVVFGLERIPYIAENGAYEVESPYRAGACGKRDLFVVAHEGAPDEVLSRIGRIKVECDR